MSNFFEFRKQIDDFTKAKNYSDALKYFKENKSSFTNEEIASNEYLVYNVLMCLGHTGHFQAADKFLETYHISINSQTPIRIINAYGWVLYYTYKTNNASATEANHEPEWFFDETINTENNEPEEFGTALPSILERIGDIIPLLLASGSDFSYSVLSFLFNIVLKTEKQKIRTNWKFINDFCDSIDPLKLHVDCKSIEVERKGKKKEMELACDRETWHTYKTAALFHLGEFKQCAELSIQALGSFEKFHYSNDIWFARRIALSKKNLGKNDEAIVELQKILKKKNEWFIQKELAEIFKESGDNENALKYALEAIQNHGDLEYKIDLLILLGELYQTKGENETAFKHFSLSKLLRQKNQWRIPEKLTNLLKNFSFSVVQESESENLKQALFKIWSTSQNKDPLQHSQNIRSTGTILKILHNDEKGVDGFLKISEDKSVYFRINPDDKILQDLKVGLEVEFKLLPAKGDKREKAIHIKKFLESPIN
jgi:tetratricopeptide (TPR) repeat protein